MDTLSLVVLWAQCLTLGKIFRFVPSLCRDSGEDPGCSELGEGTWRWGTEMTVS